MTPAESFVWEHYSLGHTYTVYEDRVRCDCGDHYGYAKTWHGPALRFMDVTGLTPPVAWLVRRLAKWIGPHE